MKEIFDQACVIIKEKPRSKTKETPEDFQERINKLSTVADIKAVFDDSFSGTEREAMALRRWSELSMIEAEKAETMAELYNVAIESPVGSEAEGLAEKKMAALLAA